MLPDQYKTLFCVPQKNGNAYYASLLNRLYDNCTKESCLPATEREAYSLRNKLELEHIVGKRKDGKQDRHPFEKAERWTAKEIVDSKENFIMIARNPYSRLLSGYIDKIESREPPAKYDWDKIFRGGKRYVDLISDQVLQAAQVPLKGSPESFREFVEALYRIFKLNPAYLDVVNVHWRPQVQHCLLPCGIAASVLKLEEEFRWFPCFVEQFQLHEIVNTGWGDQGCFLAHNGSCDMATWSAKLMESGDSKYSVIDPIHGKGASSKTLEYYDEEIAGMVSEMYKKDLEFLGYEQWKGH